MKKIIVILVLALMLVACNENDLLGTWLDETSGMTIVFSEESCTFNDLTVPYETKDGMLTFNFEDGDDVLAYNVSGDTLTFSFPDLDDFELIYKRVSE